MLRLKIVIVMAIVAAVVADDTAVLKHGRIRGNLLKSRKGRKIFAFRGIPYAKPPVGELRFQPPQAADPWDETLDASQDAPICIQRGLFTAVEELTGQEDCLYLNVYTPQPPDSRSNTEPLDIMFWIHGGGWFSGSGSSDLYGPQYLLDKDVILVTINYRLGPLGFLSTGDAACPGNNGLKDQLAALRWVRDNIAVFGGNPNSVTIFGESAGGASVHYHMLSPASRGLFHRAISQSGNTLNPWAHAPNGTTRYQTEKLAMLLNCPTQPSNELVTCLRKKNAADIIATDKFFFEWNFDPMIPFKPVVESEVGNGDEAFIVTEPLQSLLTSDSLKLVPWMVGLLSSDGAIFASGVYGNQLVEELNQNFDEIVPIAMYFRESAPQSEQKSISRRIRKFYFGDHQINNDSFKAVTDMYTDVFFISGSNPSVKLHTARGATVYYFYLDYRGTNSYSTLFGDPTRDYGPCHLDDLMYLFPQDHYFAGSKRTPEDDQMVDTLITLWTNFARTGNPTPEQSELGTWLPVSSPDVREYARINFSGLKMENRLLEERADFWATLPHRGRIPASMKDEL